MKNIKMQKMECRIASGQLCSEHSNQPFSSLCSTLYISNVDAGTAQQEIYMKVFVQLKVQLDVLFVLFIPLCFLALHVSGATAPILRSSNCSLQP
jgi:hypothetical protein